MQKKVRTIVFPVGGFGTRFLPATKATPKEMLPVAEKPLIQYAFEEALNAADSIAKLKKLLNSKAGIEREGATTIREVVVVNSEKDINNKKTILLNGLAVSNIGFFII